MANYKWTMVPIEKAEDLTLGEGAVYKNLDESGEAVIGSTSGGTELKLNRVVKEIPHDGALGAVKGMREVTFYKPQLLVYFLTLNYTNLVYGNPVTVSDGSDADGTYKKIIFRHNFDEDDVLTNIGFKGYKLNGDIVKIKLLNAINLGDIAFGHKNKEEVIAPMTYTGCYGYATPSTVPLEIWDYSVA